MSLTEFDKRSMDSVKFTNGEVEELLREQHILEVGRQYVLSRTPMEISTSLSIPYTTVMRYIKENRARFAEWYKDEISNLRGESLARLNNINKNIWEQLADSATDEKSKPALYATLSNNEKLIAQISGVLQDKVVNKTVVGKMYNFIDKSPKANIIEGEKVDVTKQLKDNNSND